jgi:hypothetical protein
MYKVDASRIRFHEAEIYRSDRPDFHATPAVRYPYRQEPYGRAKVPLTSGGTEIIDAKVISRTARHILLGWSDGQLRRHSVWVRKDAAYPIDRSVSSYRDPYDL